ncbi:MAG: PIN domain-containing protein [Sphingobacteriaceae bacterium]|nr:MAG: PIN domain-containing protein [Sphingobacteriaceae bacterium]
MNLLFDTNILLQFARSLNPKLLMQLVNPKNQEVFVSIVSVAELKSISLQNNWGTKKLQVINAFLDELAFIEINKLLINTYVEIDAFSQCKNPSYVNYPFITPRNMGKNDLWIASTAALLGLKLVTTDADFNHLDQVFLEVQYLEPQTLR